MLEEAAFVKEDLFYEVIVPLLGVDGTAVLAISTPDKDDDNYYSMLMDMKDPDDPEESLFRTIPIGLSCDECIAAGKASSCKHKEDLAPPWKGADRQRKIEKIMEGNPELHSRENLGNRHNDTMYMFRGRCLNDFARRPPMYMGGGCDVVYCAIDPSGGGTQSDYAIVTVAVRGGQFAIVGMDSTPVADSNEVERVVHRHLADLRNSHAFRASLITLFVEANMSWIEADRVKKLASDPLLQPLYMPAFNSKNLPGVITTEHNKIAYVDTLRRLLEDESIGFATEMISARPLELKKQLMEQMRMFRRVVQKPRNEEAQSSRVFMTGKGNNRKDDLLLALMMAVYFSRVARNDDKFRVYCEKLRLRP